MLDLTPYRDLHCLTHLNLTGGEKEEQEVGEVRSLHVGACDWSKAY